MAGITSATEKPLSAIAPGKEIDGEEVMTTEGEESSDEEDLEHIVMDTNDDDLVEIDENAILPRRTRSSNSQLKFEDQPEEEDDVEDNDFEVQDEE